MADHVSGVIDSLAMAKELFPGKRNSLDALCGRLEVDNSGRTLHGALLDAELLADVYINMTRGQNAFGLDDAPEGQEVAQTDDWADVDLSAFQLPVLSANATELEAHERALTDLDKATKGRTLWRKLESAVA